MFAKFATAVIFALSVFSGISAAALPVENTDLGTFTRLFLATD